MERGNIYEAKVLAPEARGLTKLYDDNLKIMIGDADPPRVLLPVTRVQR